MKRTDLAILLATYNGSRYLEEQLDSLRTQTYHDFVCYIHDDGSSDGTQQIIMDYCSKYPQQFVYLGCSPTGGAKYNFMYLLRQVEANYYMFCDQDDVWLPKKIEKSYNALKELGDADVMPNCVFCDTSTTDKDLHVLHESAVKYSKFNISKNVLESLLNRCHLLGCAMAFNHRLREISICADIIETTSMHDRYIAIIAACCGGAKYLDEPLMLRRVHENNVTAKRQLTNKERWVARFHVRRWLKEREESFIKQYGDERASLSCIETYREAHPELAYLNTAATRENVEIVKTYIRRYKQPTIVKWLRWRAWKLFRN